MKNFLSMSLIFHVACSLPFKIDFLEERGLSYPRLRTSCITFGKSFYILLDFFSLATFCIDFTSCLRQLCTLKNFVQCTPQTNCINSLRLVSQSFFTEVINTVIKYTNLIVFAHLRCFMSFEILNYILVLINIEVLH